MNRLVELNTTERTVRVEPGIVLEELNAELEKHRLCLPLDLSTSNRATLGGMIANNSAGTRSIKYGKTIDYVREMTVLLADGSRILAPGFSCRHQIEHFTGLKAVSTPLLLDSLLD